MQIIEVYLEIGKKRTFAGALSWPGWCRSGQDEAAALQALCDVGERYASVLCTDNMLRTEVVQRTGVVQRTTNAQHPSPIEFQAPADPSAFVVVERLQGDATTDFGAPGQVPAWDQAAMMKRSCCVARIYCALAGRPSTRRPRPRWASSCAWDHAAAGVTWTD